MPTWSSSGKQPALGVYCLVVCTAVLLTLAAQTGHAFAVYRPYDDTNSLAERERRSEDVTAVGGSSGQHAASLTLDCVTSQCQQLTGLALDLCLLQCKLQADGRPEEADTLRHAQWKRRQVDPFNSCIEANCANMNGGGYMQCAWRRCIMPLRLGRDQPEPEDNWPADFDLFDDDDGGIFGTGTGTGTSTGNDVDDVIPAASSSPDWLSLINGDEKRAAMKWVTASEVCRDRCAGSPNVPQCLAGCNGRGKRVWTSGNSACKERCRASSASYIPCLNKCRR